MKKTATISAILAVVGFMAVYVALCYLVPGWRLKLHATAWVYFTASLRHMALLKGVFAMAAGLVLATLPFLQQMSVSHPEWFSLEMLADMVAVSESTPGPLGVNMATYVGYTVGGVAGALVATFALVLPSILVILIIAAFLKHYMNSPLVQRVFAALRPAVTGLIAAAGYAVIKLAVWQNGALEWRSLALFVLVLAATQWKKLSRLHPIVYIGIGAVAGMALGM